MKATVLFLCTSLLIISHYAEAQQDEEVILPPASRYKKRYMPYKKRFRFEQFNPVTIYDVSKKAWGLDKVNYDIYLEEMVMINDRGDTLALDNLSEFKYFVIGNCTFIHSDHEYYEVLESTDTLKVCVRQMYEQKSSESPYTAAFGARSGTTPYTTAYRVATLNKGGEELRLQKRHFCFLGDKDDKMIHANKHNFQIFFPAHKAEIKAFIESNKVDFESEKDVKKLFEYCIGLYKAD